MSDISNNNPLLGNFSKYPFGAIPFDKISIEDFEEAFKIAIDNANAEINSIADNPEPATFQNTIVALERAGKALSQVSDIFFPLTSALSNERMMQITNNIIPLLSDYTSSIPLNGKLWERVRSVYDIRESLGLDIQDKKLLDNTYEFFANTGAELQGNDREEFRQLKKRLSELTNTFSQNVLKELNNTNLILTSEDLNGLPDDLTAEAKSVAEAKGLTNKYLFTLDAPVYSRFLKYSTQPHLREKIWRLYSGRNLSGEFNNQPVILEIVEIRRKIAQLLGYKTYADYATHRRMAQNPANVFNLLHRLRDAYAPAVKLEMQELTIFASDFEGHEVSINPWDYAYYSNLLKNSRYSYNEEALRPYFPLESVIRGVFGLANRLYGLKFKEHNDLPVYHPDVKVFEVTDSDNRFIGLLYTDFFPRESKQSGAWMTGFREQYVDENGNDVRPLVSIVMNFTKPQPGKPSLLTPGEVRTFLHEFGHALHGLLSQCRYSSLSGTNVYRDFVELPSQFNENYLLEKEFLDSFAHHYQTGECIPPELIHSIVKAQQYGASYACFRQLAFGLIDMKWYNSNNPITASVAEIENQAISDVRIFPETENALTSPQFSHIFSGGYAAGYYSYKWAEVLDADAFSLFAENGIFNKKTADSFRANILSRGGSEHPTELYRRFRGKEPSIDALLRRDGIIK